MFSFEKLDVYERSVEFYRLVSGFLKANRGLPVYLRNQLGRASLSIPLNIAEGSAKFSSKDRKNYLSTARASAFECASIIRIMKLDGEASLEFETQAIVLLERISRILFAMIKNLNGTS